MKTTISQNRRILLVDDNPAIHDDFRRVLTRDHSAFESIDAAAAAILGEPETPEPAPGPAAIDTFLVDSAHQGEEALELVTKAVKAGQPYALAFVDMRMPPGWNGLTTITRIWEVDPELQVVICTAFSDRSWSEIQRTLTARDRWLVVKKPFDEIEVLQLAHALTEKWNLARAAKLRNDTLEVMVRARTEELEHMNRVKNEFLANVSHEMLTPMNSVIGSLDLLVAESEDQDSKEMLNFAVKSANGLLRMIHQILSFNRAEGAVSNDEWKEGDVRERVRAQCGRFLSPAAEKGLELQIVVDETVPERVVAPFELIDEVLGALVDNAVKFTLRGSVSILVHWHAPARNKLHFTVQDTGIGLTPRQLEWIRIPFAKVDGANNRNTPGLGLGLAVARRLLSLVGSELQIRSQPDQGTWASFAVRSHEAEVEIGDESAERASA